MILKGRAISSGKVEGKVIKIDEAFSFLGGVNASTGDLNVREGNISEKIFVFPKGKGSTVGSFVMYDLMVHGKAPAAVVNESAETIVTTGAVISSIPMVDMIDVNLIKEGDQVLVDGTEGTIEIKDIRLRKVVSSALISDGKVLLLKRPDRVWSFPGKWSLVAGKIENEESPEDAAVREIMEETQIKVGKPDVSVPPVYVREKDVIWEVFPFLFKVDDPEPILNEENEEFMWMSLDESLAGESFVSLTDDVVRDMISKM